MQPVVAASVVAALVAYPSDMEDVVVRPRGALPLQTWSADVSPQPHARFRLIGGDESCPGMQRFQACAISAERCPYGMQVLLISSPGDSHGGVAVASSWIE